MSEESDWEVIDRWESDIGVYITVRASTGEETTKNFNKKRFTEERAERSFDKWFRELSKEDPVEGRVKKGFKKLKDK